MGIKLVSTKVKKVLFSPQLMLMMVSTGLLSLKNLTVIGIPGDAELAGVELDKDVVILYVTHESFDEVKHGESIPQHEVVFTEANPTSKSV